MCHGIYIYHIDNRLETSLKSLRLRDLLTFGYFTRPYWAFLGLTRPYWALLGLNGPYWALLSLT